MWLLRVPVGGTDGHVGGCVVLLSIPDGADGPVWTSVIVEVPAGADGLVRCVRGSVWLLSFALVFPHYYLEVVICPAVVFIAVYVS